MMDLSTRILRFLDVAERAVTAPEIADALAAPDERIWEELATMVEPGFVRYDEREDGSTAWRATDSGQELLDGTPSRESIYCRQDWAIGDFAEQVERIEQRLDQVLRAVSGTAGEISRPTPRSRRLWTDRQDGILEVLRERGDMRPTEIAALVGSSSSAASSALTRLRRDGHVWNSKDYAHGKVPGPPIFYGYWRAV